MCDSKHKKLEVKYRPGFHTQLKRLYKRKSLTCNAGDALLLRFQSIFIFLGMFIASFYCIACSASSLGSALWNFPLLSNYPAFLLSLLHSFLKRFFPFLNKILDL